MAKHLAVASVSTMLILSAASYVFATTTDALAAFVSSVASRQGHESIQGRIQGSPSGKVTIEVMSRQRGKQAVIRTIKLGRNGRFDVPVKPGSYTLVIMDGAKRVTESLTIQSRSSKFVVVKVTHQNGGFGIAPIIFNY